MRIHLRSPRGTVRPLVLLLALAPHLAAQVGVDAALDPTRLAVELVPGHGALDVAALEARLGVGVVAERLYGPREYRLIELAGVLPAGPDRSARLRAVAALPEVAFATPVWSGEPVADGGTGLPEFPTRHVLVRFEARVPEGLQRAALASVGGLEVERSSFGGMEHAWRLRASARTGEEVLAQVGALAALPGIRWAIPDRVLGHVLHDVIPDDPLFPQCWGLDNTGQSVSGTAGVSDVDMNASAAWDLTQGDPGLLVVVLDNGVDLTHPDLNLAGAADFTGSGSGGGPTAANACHGTAVAGCIAARIDNALGTVGVAPACRVLSASVSVPDGSGTCDQGNAGFASTKVDALAWAEVLGARVSNWSFGMGSDDAVKDKLVETKANGMIHFASAGNSFPSAIGFPASFHAVHAIGSVQSDGTKAGTSQTGGVLAFSAPGVNIQTIDRQGAAGYNTAMGTAGDYTLASGTSFASPYAAGVAALVLSRQPSLSPHDVWVCLVASSRERGAPGWDSSFGHGMVNANIAVRIADEMAQGYVIVDPIVASPPLSYGTIAAAVNGVASGGLILPIPGSYSESLVITKPLKLRSWGTLPTIIGN